MDVEEVTLGKLANNFHKLIQNRIGTAMMVKKNNSFWFELLGPNGVHILYHQMITASYYNGFPISFRRRFSVASNLKTLLEPFWTSEIRKALFESRFQGTLIADRK